MTQFPLQSNSQATMNHLQKPCSRPCKDVSYPLQPINKVHNETSLIQMSQLPPVWVLKTLSSFA
jgi:hypothetical protein